MELFPTQMSIISLFALPSGLKMTSLSHQEGRLCVSLLSTQPVSHCPMCGSVATRIHSRYQRRLTDLPSTGQPVRVLLTVRKFFCDGPTCPRKIFTERLAPFVAPSARVTARLQQMVPITGVTCQARDLQPQDQLDLPESDFGNQPLEAQAVDSGSARVAQVLVNHDNALVCPP